MTITIPAVQQLLKQLMNSHSSQQEAEKRQCADCHQPIAGTGIASIIPGLATSSAFLVFAIYTAGCEVYGFYFV